MFKKEIKKLISNIKKPSKILNLDIIFEGGAFNGTYHLGVCYFLKELEKQKYIKINRISGTSIGAIIGMCYFLDKLPYFYKCDKMMRKHWKKELNVFLLNNMFDDLLKDYNDQDIVNIFNNKLFITFNDVSKKETIIIQNYNNKQELKNAIINSSYLPFLSGKNVCNNNLYFDGIIPFIFNDRNNKNKDILYININHFNVIKDIFHISKESSNYGRILHGILQCYNLFNYNTNNNMCSFISKWSFNDFIILRIKQYISTFIPYFVFLLKFLSGSIHPLLQNIQLYNNLYHVSLQLFNDFILFYFL